MPFASDVRLGDALPIRRQIADALDAAQSPDV
jgi:hypothetical protein